MTTNLLVVYYSAYGHVYQLARAVADGAHSVEGAEVRVARVPELQEAGTRLASQPAYVQALEMQSAVPVATQDDLKWADGIAWGSPTRFGNMASQMKQFIDALGGLWAEGALEDKPAGFFTSSNTIHGGQETTIITGMVPLLHLGMILVGTPYGQNPQILVTDGIGGSPYGPSTLAGNDGKRQPVEPELQTARNLGSRLARAAAALKPMRG